MTATVANLTCGSLLEMDPQIAEDMSKYTEMYLTGRREIFQIVE